MTETATTEPPIHPYDVLLHLIVTLLAPLFLSATSDIALARLAAFETVADYRARNQCDLIAVAQIIAFGLAALGSLSLSMADDISITLALRLRGNANACNRSAEQNRRALAKRRADDSPPNREPDNFLSPAAEQMLAAESEARLDSHPTQDVSAELRHKQIWAMAMMQEASEITASLASLPPDQRDNAALTAHTLGNTARDLLAGTTHPPP